MKKPFRHDQVSDEHRCARCGKGIKLNVLARKERAPKLCYSDHLAARKAAQRAEDLQMAKTRKGAA